MEETEKDGAKKQLLLRLSPTLWRELAAWAEDDFRSINGQIEFLLTDCVRQRKKKGEKDVPTGARQNPEDVDS
ncbi:MAG: Arc family DNA-binding protein [Treponemataceae bacterium]